MEELIGLDARFLYSDTPAAHMALVVRLNHALSELDAATLRAESATNPADCQIEVCGA